ncbi:MAG TPA: UDP-glucose 4-epimerase GalE [Bryobacteraceae bacterium]|nr:UDP-glucose 4-epimerase GalE [Bryobacteraceae bacterium]
MNILVTGGAGYIGSHVAKALSKAGHVPTVFDNLEMGHEWAVKWGPFIKADLADQGALEAALRGKDAVVHLAGYIFVGESVKAPSKYYRNNFINSLNLLDAMTATGVRDVVFSSTAAVYGAPARVPIQEGDPKIPINPYGESKRFTEQSLEWYGTAHGIRWLALRYFNAAGADHDGEIGEMHDPETHLIPLVIDAALRKRGPVQLFGTDYPTADGTAIRDYIHVADLARAHVLGLEYLRSQGTPTALNVGTGSGYSVREVIKTVEQASGLEVPVSVGPRREGDSPELVADASRARGVLGWEPRASSLEEIVATALAWHKSHR